MPEGNHDLRRHIADAWGLTPSVDAPDSATRAISYLSAGGVQVVLKIPAVPDEMRASAALEHFRGVGAVRVLRRDGSGAFLMERVDPALPLSRVVFDGHDDHATEILCETMRKLHRHDQPLAAFATTVGWGDGFARHARSERGAIAGALLADAHDIYSDLVSSQTGVCVLHGDLHHDNIVLDENRGWLAIDPKGVIGEPAYECGAALRNPGDDPSCFARAAIVARRTDIIVERLGFDRQRVLAWSFAQGVLSAIWSVEDGEDPVRGLAYAEAVRPLL